MKAAAVPISDLPDELIISILTHLSNPIFLSTLSELSHKFNRITTDSRLWSSIYFAAWSREVFAKRAGSGGEIRVSDLEQEKERLKAKSQRSRKWKRELKSEARRAWEFTIRRKVGDANADEDQSGDPSGGGELDLRFIDNFNGGDDEEQESASSENRESPISYKQLFLKRLGQDNEILSLIKAFILNPDQPLLSNEPHSKGRINLTEHISNRYEMNSYDILKKLIDSQERSTSPSSISSSFPTALQLICSPDQVSRSPTHHLVILDVARDILEHLLRREGMKQMDYLRSLEVANRPSNQQMADLVEPEGFGNSSEKIEVYSPKKMPDPEEALLAMASFRGGDRKTVKQQLDSLTVACYLYLKHQGIQVERVSRKTSSTPPSLEDEPATEFSSPQSSTQVLVDTIPSNHLRLITKGICSFLISHGFKGASSEKFHDLDNHFLNFALLPHNRENLPLTLVSIFCSISNRLGLRTSASNFPGRIHAVVEEDFESGEEPVEMGKESSGLAEACDEKAYSSKPIIKRKRFWVDVFEGGTLVNWSELCDMLAGLGIFSRKDAYKFLDPASLNSIGLRIARNVGQSVQRAQGLPRIIHVGGREKSDSSFSTNSNEASTGMEGGESSTYLRSRENRQRFHYNEQRPDQVFLEGLNEEESAVLLNQSSSVLSPTCAEEGKVQTRASSWSDYDQRVAMYGCAQAFVRLGDAEDQRPSRRTLDWLVGLVSDDFNMDVPSFEQDLLGLSLYKAVSSPAWIRNSSTNSIPTLSTFSAGSEEGTDSENEEVPLQSHQFRADTHLLSRSPVERSEWGNLLGQIRRLDMDGEEPTRRNFRSLGSVPEDLEPLDDAEMTDFSEEDIFYDLDDIDEGPDASPRTYPQQTSTTLPDPVHRVGTVFTHRVYGYLGVILGWSRSCTASEQWQRSMNVDALPEGGRSQPFFTTLADDGSRRFVAQCNIIEAVSSSYPGLRRAQKEKGNGELVEGEWENLPEPKTKARIENNIKRKVIENENQLRELAKQRGIGQVFKCVDLENARFSLNREAELAWPDDVEELEKA